MTHVPDKYCTSVVTTGTTNRPDFCAPNMSVRCAVVVTNSECRVIIEAHKRATRQQQRQTTEHNNNNACKHCD